MTHIGHNGWVDGEEGGLYCVDSLYCVDRMPIPSLSQTSPPFFSKPRVDAYQPERYRQPSRLGVKGDSLICAISVHLRGK